MGIWDVYDERMAIRGETRRETALKREKRTLNSKVPDSLSYQCVTLFDREHGYNISSDEMLSGAIQQNVAIINSDNLNEKMIFSLPDEDFEQGSLVSWMDNYWIITELDANKTVYTRAKMIQCNYLLKWVSAEGNIIEQWSIVEDGTKYLTGEYEDRNFIVTRGDSRIAVTVARNAETAKLGRTNRFIIDDPASQVQLSYLLTKPLKLGWSFNDYGAYKFVMQEVNSTKDDNFELQIADYYKYFPQSGSDSSGETDGASSAGGDTGTGDSGSTPTGSGNGREGWL